MIIFRQRRIEAPGKRRRAAGGFAENTDGVALVEFAFMFPVLMIILMMTISLSHMMMIDRKVTVTAQAAADLIAQRQAVEADDVADVMLAAQLMLQPFAPTFDMSIAHVPFDPDNGIPEMNVADGGWRATINGAAEISKADAEEAANGTTISVPLGEAAAGRLGTPGDAVIMVRMTYSYQAIWLDDVSIFGMTLPGNLTFNKVSFARPRLNSRILSEVATISVGTPPS